MPGLNAILNGTSAVLLASGYVSILKKNVRLHRRLMMAAMAVSALFLTSYLVHKALGGGKHFPGAGWIRPVYFTILISHTILAAAIVPLAIVTLVHGLRERYDRHRKIARWTLPLWFYVSVTGVVIYFMLYRVSYS